MNPPIITLLPVCTKARVEMLSSCAGTAGGCAQYLPPVLNTLLPLPPPQTIISLPVQTAVWLTRPEGAPAVVVALHVSVLGLYRPPVFALLPSNPPQTIISLPVQTAACTSRPEGASWILVLAQLSVLGLYLLPVFKKVGVMPIDPPQMIIS